MIQYIVNVTNNIDGVEVPSDIPQVVLSLSLTSSLFIVFTAIFDCAIFLDMSFCTMPDIKSANMKNFLMYRADKPELVAYNFKCVCPFFIY